MWKFNGSPFVTAFSHWCQRLMLCLSISRVENAKGEARELNECDDDDDEE